MDKELIYYCKTCGKVERRDVKWVTLQQNVDMSFCPICNVQISKKVVPKGFIPKPERTSWVCKRDKFDKYRGMVKIREYRRG